jgi:hypothetical protein
MIRVRRALRVVLVPDAAGWRVMRVSLDDRTMALLERLCVALEGLRDDRQPGGAPPASVTRPPRAVPAAEAGAAAGEVCQTPTSPPVLEIHPHSKRRVRRDKGMPRGTSEWKTPEREAYLRQNWLSMSVRQLAVGMSAMPGARLPLNGDVAVSAWRRQLGLRKKTKDECAALRKAAGNFTGPKPGERRGWAMNVTWDQALAWADAHDPDMVLRGTPAARLAQINELRRLNGERPFVLAEREAA